MHFERSAQAIHKIIGSINFSSDKIGKPFLTALFLKYLYKLERIYTNVKEKTSSARSRSMPNFYLLLLETYYFAVAHGLRPFLYNDVGK